MAKLLALIPTLLAWIATAQQEVPVIVSAVTGLIDAIKKTLGKHTELQKLNVQWLQSSLKTLGYDPGALDNVYGPKTHAAVAAYQTAKGLTPDGWSGVTTTAAILSDLKAKAA